MYAGLMHNGKVVFLDKLSEYDHETNQTVPLAYQTNAFCFGGSFLANGTFISFLGNAPISAQDPTISDGFRGIRYLTRSADSALDGEAWHEPGTQLDSARRYASRQTMPNGTLFVTSGSLNGLDQNVASNNNPTYAILSPEGITKGTSVVSLLLVKAQPY
ncbi:hypothetical protein LTR37_005468 [Vermiconidia calcicola]|uniref:Uncharacterized protein n=1 Tax=Vermiconidia calcicola TaxID=1690605 RepID=A0ACC3NJN4_9PEZI|nr:hypothetical protein LTR37_005468 [Vermiconidia calcicola]